MKTIVSFNIFRLKWHPAVLCMVSRFTRAFHRRHLPCADSACFRIRKHSSLQKMASSKFKYNGTLKQCDSAQCPTFVFIRAFYSPLFCSGFFFQSKINEL